MFWECYSGLADGSIASTPGVLTGIFVELRYQSGEAFFFFFDR